jgi:hypothetical protein
MRSSIASVVRGPPRLSARSRADSDTGTSTTCSPRASRNSARRRPRPWAPSMAQVRCSKPRPHSQGLVLAGCDHGGGGVLVLRYGFS